jgi:hypothetical protein
MFNVLSHRAEPTEEATPLEHAFIKALSRYLSSNSSVTTNKEFSVLEEIFRYNIFIEKDGKSIGIVLADDENYNEKDNAAGDSRILASGKVDTILRFTGKDIITFMKDCILFICQFEPDFVDRKYRNGSCTDFKNSERNVLYYNMMDDYDVFLFKQRLIIERRTKDSLNAVSPKTEDSIFVHSAPVIFIPEDLDEQPSPIIDIVEPVVSPNPEASANGILLMSQAIALIEAGKMGEARLILNEIVIADEMSDVNITLARMALQMINE